MTEHTNPADELLSVVPAVCQKVTWIDRLEPDTRQSLAQIREYYRAGKYPDHSAADIYKFCQGKFGIKVRYNAFRQWLKEPANG